MERRDFLQGFASMLATAGVALPATGCLTSQQALHTTLDIDGVLGWLKQMETKILTTPIPTDTKATPKATARAQAQLTLAKKLTSGLLVVGIYNDLPPSMQRDPKMQKFLQSKVPEFDQTTLQILGYMENLTPAQRAELQEDMKTQQTAAQLKTLVEQKYTEYGVPSTRRKQFDQMYGEHCWRLKHQPADVLLDDIIGKVDRIVARKGLSKARRQQLSQAALTELYASTQPVAATSTTGKVVATNTDNQPDDDTQPSGPGGPGNPSDGRPDRDDQYVNRHRGPNRTLMTGGIIMGVAAGLGLLGTLFLFLGGGGALTVIGAIIGPTIGGSLFIGGLITLIVGAARGW